MLKSIFNLFRKAPQPIPEIPRGCNVYCQQDRILIAARITDSTWRGGPGTSFNIFKMNSDSKELGAALINAMEMQRSGLSEQDFENEIAQFFKFAEVENWKSLERNWNFITVSEEPSGNIVIQPTKQYPTGGYISEVGDPEWTSRPQPLELGECLQKAILYLYRNE